jgi:hypothetical protein
MKIINLLLLIVLTHSIAISQRLVETDKKKSYIIHNDSLIVKNLNLGQLKCKTYQFKSKRKNYLKLNNKDDLLFYVERIYQENDNKDYYYVIKEKIQKTDDILILNNKENKWKHLIVIDFHTSCISIFRLK